MELKSRYTNVNKLYKEVNERPTDIEKWRIILSEFDVLVDELFDIDNPHHSIPLALKEEINQCYRTLLKSFPYLLDIWQKWSILEYKISSTEASIKILQNAVESFPNSIQLWTDYLTALTTVDHEKLKFSFEQCMIVNGYDFNSSTLWKKYIHFTTDVNELLEVYLKVIRIPLYEYAQFFESFQEIYKKYDIGRIVPETILNDYVGKFDKESITDLSLIEKHQILDDYAMKIYTETQEKVARSWKYESNLTHQEFSLENVDEIKQEQSTWLEYINVETEIYKAKSDQDSFKLVSNLYERMLIPNCYESKLWLKYIKFIHQSSIDESERFKLQRQIYKTVNAKFIPYDDNSMRVMYVKLLINQGSVDEAFEYLFDWLKIFNESHYHKASYLEIFNEVMKLFKREYSTQFPLCLEIWIDIYLQKKSKKTDLTNVPDAYMIQIDKFLNSDSICIVIEAHLSQLKKVGDHEKIRTFYNSYHTKSFISNSVKFWNFIFQFEGVYTKNLINLKLIINYIMKSSSLPKLIIDQFIIWYCDIINANLTINLHLNDGKSDDFIIKRDLHTSNSLYLNKSSQKRYSGNNYMLKSKNKQDEYYSFIKRQFDHPGIFIDATPYMTNSCVNLDLTKHVDVPPFPTFKNVEKASQNIKYPKE